MAAHHLVLGKTIDYITGQEIVDTHDEQAKQEIARFLVEEKGYAKDDIQVRRTIALEVNGNRAVSKVDFLVRVDGKAFAIVIFGPGSLVSRERSTVAAARLVEDFAVPFAVVTNGKDAEVLDTSSGSVIGEGLESIPSREEALKKMETITFEKVPENRLEKEERILYTFDVLAERECDEFTCSLYQP
ncbi:MAG: type I restriction enzyme HsdR N-terminal domain-containing protein [Thermodesulfobacteriota bacterium]|nr:type I restriction enzyme HsdR N-terminal domain-containing protein [Thermodesulfobacteriota bacterium]